MHVVHRSYHTINIILPRSSRTLPLPFSLSLKRLMAGTGELITLTVANDDQHQSEPSHTQQQQLTGTDRSVAGHHNRFSAMLLANHYAVG